MKIKKKMAMNNGWIRFFWTKNNRWKTTIFIWRIFLENLPKSKSFHPYFEDALGDMFKAGGKRFRPMLFWSVVKIKQKFLIQIV